jgi:hypothetical protein
VSDVVIDVAEGGGDPERIDHVTGLLLGHLAGLDALRVARARTADVVPGVRGLDAAVVGTLIATTSDVAVHLAPVVQAVREWLARTPQLPRTVRIQVDGDVLEMSNASTDEQETLVDLFVARHRDRQ